MYYYLLCTTTYYVILLIMCYYLLCTTNYVLLLIMYYYLLCGIASFVISSKTPLCSGNYFNAKSNTIINAFLSTAINTGMTTIIFLCTHSNVFRVFSLHCVLTKILNIAMIHAEEYEINFIFQPVFL